MKENNLIGRLKNVKRSSPVLWWPSSTEGSCALRVPAQKRQRGEHHVEPRLFKTMCILRSVWARTVWSQWSKAARPLSGGKWKQTKEFRCLTNTELVSAKKAFCHNRWVYAPPTFCLEEELHFYVSENWNIGCTSCWQYQFRIKAALLTKTFGHYFKINYI